MIWFSFRQFFDQARLCDLIKSFHRPGRNGIVILLVAVSSLLSCAHYQLQVHDVSATSSSPSVQWIPPTLSASNQTQLEPEIPDSRIQEKLGKLALAEAVDIALQNNPDTKSAWFEARAAAADYGSALGSWFPSVTLNGSTLYSNGASSQSYSGSNSGQSQNAVTDYVAGANLSWLLFDFGERSAEIDMSRQALLAADWSHNATIQNIILQTEASFFSFAEARALLDANRTSLNEAEENLTAAEERRRVGLATDADVLQAKTARSEVKLAVQAAEGQVRVTHAALAVSMGYAANLPYQISVVSPETPMTALSVTVDQLIERAKTSRPDLQDSRALALQSAANVRRMRAAMLPSLSVSGAVDRIWWKDVPGYKDTYSASLLLQIPLFYGFSREYDFLKAKAAADAARERTRSVEQAVIYDVFAAHSAFLTANERVKTADDLLTSATQSEAVALGRYKEGVGSMLDLLSAQKSLAAARAEQINAHLDWFLSLAQLAHDVGILGTKAETAVMPNDLLPK
jgi:outer membrane protein